MPGAKAVIPDSSRDPVQEFVIPDSIRDPVQEFVIPDSIRDPVQEFVIPDSIRDPVPRVDWIADQVRNDNSEVRNDKSVVFLDSKRNWGQTPISPSSTHNWVIHLFVCTFFGVERG